MKTDQFRLSLYLSLFVLIAAIFYFVVIKKGETVDSGDINLYTQLKKSDSLSNKVTSIYSNRGLFFTFDDGRKYSFPACTNYQYEESGLSSNIEVGDSIRKKPNNDTIFLFKTSTGEKQLFIYGTYINYKN